MTRAVEGRLRRLEARRPGAHPNAIVIFGGAKTGAEIDAEVAARVMHR